MTPKTTDTATPKGMTEIRPGVWRIRVYAGRSATGSPIQESETWWSREALERGGAAKWGSGKRGARAKRAEMMAKVAKSNRRSGNETVAQLLDEWLDHCDTLGRSPTTMRGYRRLAEKVVKPEIGKVRLTKLDARDLNRLYAKLTARGLKATSVRRVHALIGAALRHAERADLVDRNVARRAQPPPVHAAQVEAPTPEQVQAMLKAAEKRDPGMATLLFLAALTGARRGELVALRWNDLDADAGTLRIARSVYEKPKGEWGEKPTKTHQERTVGLDPLGLEVLRRHRDNVEKVAWNLGLKIPARAFMFSRSPVGSEPFRTDFVTKFTAAVAEAAGVDTHLHALRHFSATQAIGAGFDPTTVAARLGHADASITLRVYSHALQQRDRDLAAALGRTLSLPKAAS